MDTLRKITLFAFVLLVAIAASAQRRMPCIRNIPTDKAITRGSLVYPTQNWNPNKTYRQAVVLISFADTDFSMDDPAAYYNRLFNESGFNEGLALGSVADYYRDQSGGLFNLQFDIYGPIKVSISAKGSSSNYGYNAIKEALAALDTLTTQDFSVYDWNGDGVVDQIQFLAAGLTGNQASGYIWPNTDYTTLNAPGKKEIEMISITCEMWKDKTLCGIGTICHEFTHCLGLPDIYPTSGSSYFSVVDEWDLMDGGNYTHKGWCPPNLSILEKMLLGWGEPTELTAATSITGMKPVSEGGETFIIRNSGHNDEFYILENRRRTNWDKGLPGEGLAIFHVDYDRDLWSSNDVNTSDSHLRYDLFHADGKDYKTWDPANNGRDPNKYVDPENWMYNKYLSTSVYPYTDPETQLINDVLNDESSPASTLFNKNAEGKLFMSKAITNVRIAADGTISFDFMGGTSGIDAIKVMDDNPAVWYDLQGRRLEGKPTRKGIYINNRKKVAL
jgi:M6 family metalloprotease-like protein